MPLGGDRPNDTRFQPKKKTRSVALERLNPFIHSISPHSSVPPVPKSIKQWQKKPVEEKLKYGFATAAANDRVVHDFVSDRGKALSLEKQIKARAAATLHAQNVAEAAAIRTRNRARDTIARIEAIPHDKRPKGWVQELTAAKRAADLPQPKSDVIWKAIQDQLTSKESKDYFKQRPMETTQVAGITTSGITGDILGTVGKMLAGIPAGVQGLVTPGGPTRGGRDAAAMLSDQANLIKMLVASPQYGSQQKKEWGDYIQQSKEGFLSQYGPGTSFGESYNLSTQHPLSALATGVGTAAAIAYPASVFAGLGRGLGLRGALAASRVPEVPRTLRLRGGERAMGVPVEGTYSRSPFIRGVIQRPFDAASRKIDIDTPVLGRVSESSRAARIKRRSLKRDVRREQATAATYLHSIGRDADAEELRAVYMRGKPDGMDEDTWLKARLDDVNEMLGGREMIIPGKADPKLVKLQRRVQRLQKKYDVKTGEVTARTIATKLEPLRIQERSLRGKVRSARERGLPTAELEKQLASVQDQLAVARGHDVGPVKDSPARAEMRAAMEQALPPEQVEVAMRVADQFARGASPDNPDAWYARISSRYAEDPESVGLDAAALLQEAGPREGLGGAGTGMDRAKVEEAFDNNHWVETEDGRGGWISHVNPDTGRATVTQEGGETFAVPFHELRDPDAEPGIFYSKAQRMANELPGGKQSPQQLRAFMEKRGVKPVEMEWTGFDDWLDVLEESGIKSVTKEEVVHFFSNPLNAFDLNETLWEQYHYDHGTHWDPDTYEGVALQDVEGSYKELMIQLPGEKRFAGSRASSHMPGINNPLVQIRFHHQRDRVVIDELQGDWGAALRDVKYQARTEETDERRNYLNVRATTLVTDLVERLQETMGIPYDALNSSTDARSISYDLQSLGNKMDHDWREGLGLVDGEPIPLRDRLQHDDPRTDLWNEWLATPERAAVSRMMRHAEHVQAKVRKLYDEAGNLSNAPHAQPYAKTYRMLGIKRMVAWAVHNGQDRIAWPQGIIPAVRYGKVDPSSHLDPIGGSRGSPEDHPSYPDEDDYERGHVYHESEFDEPQDLGPPQEALFGTAHIPWNGPVDVTWRGRLNERQLYYPESTPMGATTPYRYTNDDLDTWEISVESVTPGQHLWLPEGPLAGTFGKVTRIDSEGIDVAPSGISGIEVRGDQWQGDEQFEVEVNGPSGREYGSGNTVESALRDAGYGDLADSEWFDDMESHIDSGWQTETDHDAYTEATDDFMERWNDGHYDDGYSEGEDAFYDIDEVARLDYSHYQGLADLYDNVLPSEIKKEWGKKYGVEVRESSTLGKLTTEGQRDAITDRGNVPLWEMRIPPEMAEDVRAGQTFFQTATPISDSMNVEVKGAVELLGNRRFRLTLFNGADISTVIHELGHISLHDLDADSLNTIERDLAGGHSFKAGQWTRDDHERFARAWERFFSTGYASTTSLRRAFGKIMDWMRQVYDGIKALGEPITPEVARVFENRLGKVGIDEGDRLNWNPELQRWGVLLSHAKGELESYEARAQIAREKGTDEGIRAEIVTATRKQDAAYKAGDQEMWDRLQGQIDAAQENLRDRDMLQESRSTRRHKLLTLRAKELERALQKPDSRRYQGATQAADFLQGERETILRDVFGDIYDEVFADRRDQESQWLAARGMLSPDDVGAGHGFLPYRRPTTMGTRLSEAARPLTGRFGKPKTDKLNLHVRNQMLLWQQGDYTADIHVLHEGYIRALAFKAQYDMRNLFHQIGEGVGPEGPKEGWYLIDLDAKPLPREWKSANTQEAIADQLKPILDGLDADDSQLALSLTRYAENWIHQDPARAKQPDGGYGNVRQVHPRVVEAMMLPYTGPTKANPLVGVASMANTMARMSLIYANPGYIPSNIIANFVMLVAERGVFAFSDMVQGAHIVAKDSVLFNRILGGRTDEGKRFLVSAETGETHTTASQRGSVGGPRGQVERLEGATANQLSTWADEWMRAAAWSGIASKRGYRGHAAQMRLLDAKTEKTRRDKDWVSEKATNAMINFDRLTPWEQRWLRPVLFVWPFIRGSIAWPIDYAMEHPARAGAVVALTRGPGEQEREELGATPSYYPSMALVSKKGTVGQVANLGSVNPLGSLGQFMAVATAAFESATGKNPTGPFLNLAGYLAPQYDFFTQVIQGRDEFGGEATIKDIAKEQGADFVPFLPITLDILDETKPAVLMDQGVIDTIKRRTLRFTPQKTNLAILNQQAKGRQAGKTVSQKKDAEIKTARAAWNHIAPGEHMPRIIEQSIESYYSVQELRAQLKDELKKQKDYQPSKREPTLTPLQDAAIVYDIFAARFPEAVRQAPDPTEVLDQYGEAAVTKYRQNLEKALFRGKYAADKARAAAKRKAKAAA